MKRWSFTATWNIFVLRKGLGIAGLEATTALVFLYKELGPLFQLPVAAAASVMASHGQDNPDRRRTDNPDNPNPGNPASDPTASASGESAGLLNWEPSPLGGCTGLG